MSRLRLALCQMNATVGDLAGNSERIRAGIDAGRKAGAQVVLFPELALSGYPPEDLLLRAHFLEDIEAKLHELAGAAEGIVAIVGFPERGDSAVYNSAAVLASGSVHAIYRKVHLPNYGVFDEQRYFKAGSSEGMTIELNSLLESQGPRTGEQRSSDELEEELLDEGFEVVLGVTVCEDLWVDGPPASAEAAAGARLILNASASPYHAGKGLEREQLFGKRARETGAYVAFCGMVGGQDELVFDGHSFVLDPNGETIARGAQFLEDLIVCDIDLANGDAPRARGGHPLLRTTQPSPNMPESRSTTNHEAHTTRPHSAAHESTPRPPCTPIASREQEVYEALALGLHDYVEKNGFGSVVLGLSGGIDSALVACLAADALGAERVNVAIMPSPYSSSATQEDARMLARALGLSAHELTIEPVMDAYTQTLQADFEGLEAGPDRGEPASPHPRQPADGALQQVWLARADDRQQVGDVRRLYDAVRRPRGRLCGHQGCPKDARLPARTLAQRSLCSASTRATPAPQSRPRRYRYRSSSARLQPSCARTRPTKIPCPHTSCSTASCTATSSSTAAASS